MKYTNFDSFPYDQKYANYRLMNKLSSTFCRTLLLIVLFFSLLQKKEEKRRYQSTKGDSFAGIE